MLSHIRRWLRSWTRGNQSVNCVRPNSHTSTRPLEVLHLEDRTLPSVSIDPTGLQSGPQICSCPMCHGGNAGLTDVAQENSAAADPYKFSNGTSNPTGVYRWAQPGGLGSTITITYSFHSSVTNGLNGLSYAQLRAAVQEALGRWAAVAPIRFVEMNDSGPSFLTGVNYDSTNLPMIRIGARAQDGQYGTLAYAYYPTAGLGGDLVLDSSELWSNTPSGGRIDVTEVLLHELGHALGLGHESGTTAIMNPTYARRFSGPGTSYLFQDDINGIRALYGSGTGAVIPIGSSGNTGATPPPATPTGPTFVVSNGRLTVTGTAGNDTFIFQAGTTSHTVSANGTRYTVDPNLITQVVFLGGNGTDSVFVMGTSGNETALLNPSSLIFSGTRISLSASGFETVVVTGNGGSDTAVFSDTAGNDSVTLRSNQATLQGSGFSWQFNGFSNVTTTAQFGGTDTVNFYGTAGDDTFTGTNSSAVLRGTGYQLTANTYEVARVNGGQGGNDRASLVDGTGNDTFQFSNGLATLRYANGFQVQTYLFGPTYAYSSNGGSDAAWLYGTTGNDTFTAGPSVATLSTSFGIVGAVGFRNTYAVGNGGTDTMYLTGSTGNDSLVDTPTYSRLETSGRAFHGYNFSRVFVAGMGGFDTAYLYDSAVNDNFSQNGNRVVFTRGSGATTTVTDFRAGTVYASAGGTDTASLYGSANNDIFTTNGANGTLSAGNSTWTLANFDIVILLNGGGLDQIRRQNAPLYRVINSSNWTG